MFGIGTGEILLILVIAMLVVGPERMVEFSRTLGHLVAQFRSMTGEATQEFREAFSLEETEKKPELAAATEAADATTEVVATAAEAQAAPALEASEGAQGGAEAESTETVTLEEVLADELVDGEIEVEASTQPPSIEAETQAEAPVETAAATQIELAALVPEDQDVEPTIIETAEVAPVEVAPQEPAPSPAAKEDQV